MISVPKVEVSQDLKNADIFLSFYNEDKKNEPKNYFNEFSKYKKSIKYKLGLSLKLKYMPKINFILAFILSLSQIFHRVPLPQQASQGFAQPLLTLVLQPKL